MDITNKYRTHNCGELRIEHEGQTVKLSGWLFNIRDKGQIIFITLRDHYGVTQAVVDEADMMEQIRKIPRESTVCIEGLVKRRTDINNNMPTGEIEIFPTKIEVLGLCTELLPFEITNSFEASEEARLKHRFLDLRNEKNHRNIVMRSQVIASIRNRMVKHGFMEIQTPILTSSSPEGARDFIVPSRLNPGRFYALPQAPQQFKQLLMVSGFDRYFQIAPCFRDEDARADRSPGEFYQLDMEMAFATQDDVFAVTEDVLYGIFEEFSGGKVSKPPFARIKYNDALEKYGTDKPDLRNPLTITDITEVFAETEFNGFKDKQVKAIIYPEGSALARRFFDNITKTVEHEGGRLAWLKSENGALTGSVAKFLSDKEKENLLKDTKGSAIFIMADEDKKKLTKLMGFLRNELGKNLNLDNKEFKFVWIVDFPMFEEEDGVIGFSHNPFSMPQGGFESLERDNPLDILAYQYDLVCNGIEFASGAVRNHSPQAMVKAFEIAGYPASVVENKFPALYNAFKFGAPPHAGIAPGIDRIIMLLCDEPNIREVIAFPMNKSAQDILMNAPSEVTEKQLEDVHIRIREIK